MRGYVINIKKYWNNKSHLSCYINCNIILY